MRISIREIPYRLFDWIQIVASVLTIVGFGLTVFFVYPNVSINWFLLSISIASSIFGIGMLFTAIKLRALSWGRFLSYSEFHQLSHVVRDSYYDILNQYKIGSLTMSYIETQQKIVLETALEGLCKIFENISGKKVCSCIKLIESNDGSDMTDSTLLTRENAVVVTLLRSKNSERVRNNANGPKMIAENTDFSEILFGGKEHFYRGNLLKYEKKLIKIGESYDNTTSRWENRYRATIVSPICIESKYLHYVENDNSYDIIGFLCVDTMSTSAFRPSEEKINTDIVGAYADKLYGYLEHCRHYILKISQDSENEKVSKPN